MTCPVCRLENPPGAIACDCGFRFDMRTGGVRASIWTRYRAILILVIPILFGLAVWALVALNAKLALIGDPG